MGENFAEGVILDIEATWQESDPHTPLVCFLSMGSDPTNMIEHLAKKQKLECRSISMGQGQEVHARRLMQTSMANVSIPGIIRRQFSEMNKKGLHAHIVLWLSPCRTLMCVSVQDIGTTEVPIMAQLMHTPLYLCV